MTQSEARYKVLHDDGEVFEHWVILATNLTLKEAKQYVRDKSRLFREPKRKFKLHKQ